MFSVLFAACVLVWLWAVAMRHAVVSLAGTANPVQQRVYLTMAVLAGAATLVLVASHVMPGSVLSAGWSQEQLLSLTNALAPAATLVAMVALWRGHCLLPGRSGKPQSVNKRTAPLAAHKKSAHENAFSGNKKNQRRSA